MASIAVDESVTATVISAAPLEAEQPVNIVAGEDSKPRKQKKQKKSSPQQQQDKAVPAAAAPELPENQYVSVVSKKIRNLKKKLEKIREIETKRDQGKKINEQQIEALSRKDEMLRLQAEYESIRQLLVEVQAQETAPKESADVPSQTLPPPVVEAPPAPVDTKSPLEYELDGAKRLLSLFHTVSLHMGLGKELPSALDFFRRVLLGSTRPPEESSFIENLNESIGEARKYLYRDNREVAQGLTYAQLEDAVNDIISKAQPTEDAEEAVAAEESPKMEEVEAGFQFIQEPSEVVEEEAQPAEAESQPALEVSDAQTDEMPAAEDIVDALIDEVVVDNSPAPVAEPLEEAEHAGQEADAPPRESESEWQKTGRNQRNNRGRGSRPRHNSGRDGRPSGGERRPRRSQNPEGKDSDGQSKSDGQWRQQRGGPRGSHHKVQQRKENDNTSSNGPISRQRNDPIPAAH